MELLILNLSSVTSNTCRFIIETRVLYKLQYNTHLVIIRSANQIIHTIIDNQLINNFEFFRKAEKAVIHFAIQCAHAFKPFIARILICKEIRGLAVNLQWIILTSSCFIGVFFTKQRTYTFLKKIYIEINHYASHNLIFMEHIGQLLQILNLKTIRPAFFL